MGVGRYMVDIVCRSPALEQLVFIRLVGAVCKSMHHNLRGWCLMQSCSLHGVLEGPWHMTPVDAHWPIFEKTEFSWFRNRISIFIFEKTERTDPFPARNGVEFSYTLVFSPPPSRTLSPKNWIQLNSVFSCSLYIEFNCRYANPLKSVFSEWHHHVPRESF